MHGAAAHSEALFLFQIVLLVVVGRLCGALLVRIGQPGLRILIPIAHTERSIRAVEFGCALARPTGASAGVRVSYGHVADNLLDTADRSIVFLETEHT